MKICSCCKIEKDESEYYYRKESKKYRNKCKKCTQKQIKIRANNLREAKKCLRCSNLLEENNTHIYCYNCLKKGTEYLKNITEQNKCRNCRKDLKINSKNTYCENCLIEHNKKNKEHRLKLINENKCVTCGIILINNTNAIYCNNCNIKINLYRTNRYKNDIFYKLRSYMSATINFALRKNKSSKQNNSIIKYISYTIKQLKQHLENQFEPWMTWENQGSYQISIWDDNDKSTWTWQIDHIIPQSVLPYTSMEDENFKKCWALENLRPLSAKENLIKSNKILTDK